MFISFTSFIGQASLLLLIIGKIMQLFEEISAIGFQSNWTIVFDRQKNKLNNPVEIEDGTCI